MASQSKAQRGTMERVMHEFKHGELRTAGGNGPKVTDRRQAIAIGLEDAGATNRESPAENRRHLARTKAKEASGQTAEAETEGERAQAQTIAKGQARASAGGRHDDGASKAELYERARRRNISGRSTMSKAELQRALAH